ncbi:MAG: hypothetical protein Q9187_007071, partial [Circinaria calcarea]
MALETTKPDQRTRHPLQDAIMADIRSRKHQLPQDPSDSALKTPRADEDDEAVKALTSQVESNMAIGNKRIPPPPLPFRDIEEIKFRQCVLATTLGHWFGAFHGKPLDYRISVGIDGGRFGQPKLCIRFDITKVLGKVIDAAQNYLQEYKTCEFVWTPGPGDIKDLRGFNWEDRHNYDEVDVPSKSLLNSLTADSDKKLFCVNFYSNFTEKLVIDGVEASSEVWKILKPKHPDVVGVLDEIAKGNSLISIWFLATPRLEDFINKSFIPFQHAVQYQLPTLYQYMDENGDYIVDLRTMEKIDVFQGGMYAKYPTKEIGEGKDKKRVIDMTRGPIAFHTLAEKHYFREPAEARLFTEVGAVREAQFQEGRVMHLAIRPHRVQLVRVGKMPPVTLSQGNTVKDIAPKIVPQKVKDEFKKTFKAYIFLTPDNTGFKETVPPGGEIINLDFGQIIYRGGKANFIRDSNSRPWFGRVVTPDPGAMAKTSADFCLQVTRPNSAELQLVNDSVDILDPKKMINVWLQPQFNDTPVTREIQAIRKLFDGRPELEIIRETIMGKPDMMGTRRLTDLTKGPSAAQLSINKQRRNQKKYQQYLDGYRSIIYDRQLAVLESATHISNLIQLVRGAPGSGKSLTIATLVYLLVVIGHKVLVVAPSNGAVDENAHKIHALKPEWLKNLKYLRLETVAEMKATATTVGDVRAHDPNEPTLSKAAQEQAADHDLDIFLGEVLAKAAELEVNQSEDLTTGVTSLACDYSQMREGKQSVKTFPIAASMPFRVEEIVAGICKPFEQYSESDVATMEREGTLDKAFKTVRNYKQLIQKVKDDVEPVSRAAQQFLVDIQRVLEERAIREADVLITTCTNSGWEDATGQFRATVVIIDEAAQATLATTLIPLTHYSRWDAAYIVGDEKQLAPTHVSAGKNEAGPNYGTSLFELMVAKGVNPIVLNMQFRMCPAISQWPSRYFYHGDLVDSELVKQDNPTRAAVREVSRIYGIRPGSEYFFIDVVNGRSRVEAQGTSLQNYPNADAILKLVKRLIDHGVRERQISILTYYRGQIKTIALRRDMDEPLAETVATVDSYQGQEADVTIIDLVAAAALSRTEGSYTGITSHLRNSNRLCVGATRG